jgi:phosphatidylethanolamine/phosphatidyl-N-methylethanolamine N-methyltransferase
MEKRDFIKEFMKNRKMIGSLRPSSRFLTFKILQNINFNSAKTIVELGPGTGVFTREILDKMNKDCKLLVFELNSEFYQKLKVNIQDHRLILIHDDAEKLEYYLEKYGLEKADIIVSSLPLTNFSPELRESIIQKSKSALKDDGKFIQFQYSLQSKSYFLEQFSEVKVDFTLWNLPPAFVFSCQK